MNIDNLRKWVKEELSKADWQYKYSFFSDGDVVKVNALTDILAILDVVSERENATNSNSKEIV